MAKIRGIKPELWSDVDFIELTPYARLLWIGMWNFACDNGHLPDKSKQLKMRILPTDDVNCADLLAELVEHRRILRADGWLTIPNFAAHQKPNKRYWTTCEMDGCGHPKGDPQREIPGAQVGTKLQKVSQPFASADGDGEGEGDVKVIRGDKSPPAKRATQLPTTWQPTDKHHTLAAERRVNLPEELDKFRDWCISTGASKKDWDATFRNWIRNARQTLPPAHTTANAPAAGRRLVARQCDNPTTHPQHQWEWLRNHFNCQGVDP